MHLDRLPALIKEDSWKGGTEDQQHAIDVTDTGRALRLRRHPAERDNEVWHR